MLIHEITPRNILSFGPDTQPIKLGKLNVLIGPNGSGKSNLIDVISVLQAAPDDISAPFRAGGNISEWLWKSRNKKSNNNLIIIDTKFIFDHFDPLLSQTMPGNYLIHKIELGCHSREIRIEGEILIKSSNSSDQKMYDSIKQEGSLIDKKTNKEIKNEEITESLNYKSAFNVFNNHFAPSVMREISQKLKALKIYKNIDTGPNSFLRTPQKGTLPNDFLLPDASNLALIMNKIDLDSDAKENFIKHLKLFYDDIDDYKILIEGATAQIFLKEKGNLIPVTRLSDGTLRYMCLLAILCHPNPPALICIDEPELGLHPDVLPSLADLLIEASERTQIIVTTHSEILVDAMTEQPESVLVTEKIEGQTSIKPLDPEELRPWLEKYRLGNLWISGDIGGKRW